MSSEQRPPLTGILETVLYCTSDTEKAARRFYEEVLGFRSIGRSSYRVGSDVFLLFNLDSSQVQERPPPHGAYGSIHVCFLTSPQGYAGWKDKIADSGVEIVQEITWDETGLNSFYFKDPAGNLLEIADGDLWPP